MKRIVLGALVGAGAAIVICAAMLLSPVHVRESIDCGSVLMARTPDPTAEDEHGCSDVRHDWRGMTLLVAIIAGPMAIGVGAATAASRLAFAR